MISLVRSAHGAQRKIETRCAQVSYLASAKPDTQTASQAKRLTTLGTK